MAKIYYQEMTPAGYRAIEEQIEALKQKRPTLITRLKAARALGDLSENTEYSTAKRELRHLESRLRYLDKQLTYAKVIDVSDDGKVALGKVVTIRFLDDQEEATYQIVGRHQAEQASLTEEVLAFDSPLGLALKGLALKGHTAGTTVTVHAPAASYQVTIITVKVR